MFLAGCMLILARVMHVLAAPALPNVEPLDDKLDKRGAYTFSGFACKEAWNGQVDAGICKHLGIQVPTLTDCATGASTWTDKEEKLGALSSRGEYVSGTCAVSVYNQGKGKVRYSRALLGNWWNAAAAACLYPGSPYDSAYCTLSEDSETAGPVVLVMTVKDHNIDFGANTMTG